MRFEVFASSRGLGRPPRAFGGVAPSAEVLHVGARASCVWRLLAQRGHHQLFAHTGLQLTRCCLLSVPFVPLRLSGVGPCAGDVGFNLLGNIIVCVCMRPFELGCSIVAPPCLCMHTWKVEPHGAGGLARIPSAALGPICGGGGTEPTSDSQTCALRSPPSCEHQWCCIS